MKKIIISLFILSSISAQNGGKVDSWGSIFSYYYGTDVSRGEITPETPRSSKWQIISFDVPPAFGSIGGSIDLYDYFTIKTTGLDYLNINDTITLSENFVSYLPIGIWFPIWSGKSSLLRISMKGHWWAWQNTPIGRRFTGEAYKKVVRSLTSGKELIISWDRPVWGFQLMWLSTDQITEGANMIPVNIKPIDWFCFNIYLNLGSPFNSSESIEKPQIPGM